MEQQSNTSTAKGWRNTLAFKFNAKSSTTHHAEGNNMTSPIQTAVGKGKSNLLITQGLLKI